MNKLAIALSAAVAVGASFSASAQSGTINIEGHVTAVTCDITWPGNGDATENPLVQLPTVPTTSLTAAGATAGKKPITLMIGGAGALCTSGKAALELNPNRDAEQANGYLNNTASGGGEATNVQVGLRDASDKEINLSTPWRSEEIDLSGTPELIEFAAEYRASGAATAGTVNAAVNYTIDYN